MDVAYPGRGTAPWQIVSPGERLHFPGLSIWSAGLIGPGKVRMLFSSSQRKNVPNLFSSIFF